MKFCLRQSKLYFNIRTTLLRLVCFRKKYRLKYNLETINFYRSG